MNFPLSRLVVALAFGIPGITLGQTGPTLTVQGLPDQRVRILWPISAQGYSLESSDSIAQGGVWAPVTEQPQAGPDSYELTLQILSTSRFYRLRQAGNADSDNDGLPDTLEISLGLDPNKADTDGDGIPDGNEDYDNDGLSNKWEHLNGYDPKVADSNGNGVPDGLEDPDNDGLSNRNESTSGGNPLSADTDGDGWDDNGEFLEGTNPADANSEPNLTVASVTASFLNAAPESIPAGTVLTATTTTISYLNAVPETLPAGTELTTASQVVSYLNAASATVPAGTVLETLSAVASYRNECG